MTTLALSAMVIVLALSFIVAIPYAAALGISTKSASNLRVTWPIAPLASFAATSPNEIVGMLSLVAMAMTLPAALSIRRYFFKRNYAMSFDMSFLGALQRGLSMMAASSGTTGYFFKENYATHMRGTFLHVCFHRLRLKNTWRGAGFSRLLRKFDNAFRFVARTTASRSGYILLLVVTLLVVLMIPGVALQTASRGNPQVFAMPAAPAVNVPDNVVSPGQAGTNQSTYPNQNNTPIPEFSGVAVVAFSALAASLYLLRTRRK